MPRDIDAPTNGRRIAATGTKRKPRLLRTNRIITLKLYLNPVALDFSTAKTCRRIRKRLLAKCLPAPL